MPIVARMSVNLKIVLNVISLIQPFYIFLTCFIRRNHPAVLGENNSNLIRIVQIIAEAAAAEVFEQYPDCAGRLKTILSQVQVSLTLKHFLKFVSQLHLKTARLVYQSCLKKLNRVFYLCYENTKF